MILVCLSSTGVEAQTNTRVIGKLKDLKAGTVVYLTPSASRNNKDSVIAENGTFEFNLTLEEGDYYGLKIGVKRPGPGNWNSISFYLQPGEVKIKGSATNMHRAKFSGSKFVDEENDFKNYLKKNSAELSKYEPVLAELRKARETNDTARINALEPQRKEYNRVQHELYRKWFIAHPSSPISAWVLVYRLEGKHLPDLQELLDHLHPEAKQNALAKRMITHLEKKELTAIGKPAPDFVQNDTAGNPVALKDFRGKYVLIDFWASWCVPCRAVNPKLVKAYNKYKDKNFTIISVSLDQPNAKEKWLKAIHDDKLTWTHVSDLKYWDNAVAKLYGISSLPRNLLIGPDGVILAKGGDLEENLRKFIK